MTPQEIEDFLGNNHMQRLRYEGFHKVMERPFLRMRGRYFLLHPRAMENALAAGVFYAALPAGKYQDYFAYVGQFFQEYIADILQRIAHAGGYVYSGELCYVRSSDGMTVASNDHFLFQDGALLFFEDRYARIPKQLLTTLDPAAITTALDQRVLCKSEQLARNIVAYLSGDFEVPGVDRASVSAIYPVLVLPHAFPRGPAIQAYFDAFTQQAKSLASGEPAATIKPFEIMEAEALEGLAGLEQLPAIHEILDRKFDREDSRCDFFKNHLILNERLPLRIWSDQDMVEWYNTLKRSRERRLAAENS